MDPPHQPSLQNYYAQPLSPQLNLNSPQIVGGGAEDSPATVTGAESSSRLNQSSTPNPNVNDNDVQSPAKKRKRANNGSIASLASINGTTLGSPQVPTIGPDGQPHSLAEIDALIAQKRKPREKTSCHPCRKRKVGCDRRLPCQTCIDRRHPEVCVYEDANVQPNPFQGLGVGPILAPPQSPFSNLDPHGLSQLGHVDSDTVNVPRGYLDRLMMKIDRLESHLIELTSDVRNMMHPDSNGFSRSPIADRHIDNQLRADSESRHATMEGVHTKNQLTGQTVHVGANSVPALVMALAKSHGELGGNESTDGDFIDWNELMGGSILPLFGLDNESATYPFVDLWSASQGPLGKVKQLCDALPSENDCNKFFAAYRDTAHVVYPGVADIKKFEEGLSSFNIRRAQGPVGGLTEQSIYGKPLPWIALLFAALASGCQCTDLPRKNRELTAKVFVCCSFECLRLTNFLSTPTIESVQAMLVFGNVISNMYNAGVSWAMLGLCIRLSQSLGLHKECPPGTSLAVKNERSKIWWAVVWQDSLLSITYDRASSSSSLDGPTHFPPDFASGHGSWTFEECMYRLCSVSLNIVRERHSHQDVFATLYRMVEHEKELSNIMTGAADYIRNSAYCRTEREKLQHWAFYLHKSYIVSELCRPAIGPAAPKIELSQKMRRTCVENLGSTVQAWLGLNSLTPFACRSWAAMHRSLSSALLLGVLGEPAHNTQVRFLLTELLRCLEEITTGIDRTEVSAPVERSIYWLKKLTVSATATPAGSSDSMFDLGSEDSPYAVMDRMIWGAGSTP